MDHPGAHHDGGGEQSRRVLVRHLRDAQQAERRHSRPGRQASWGLREILTAFFLATFSDGFSKMLRSFVP